MGLIKLKPSGVEQPKLLDKQQKSFACSYCKDVVVKMIEVGLLTTDEQIENSLYRFERVFEEMLK